MWLFIFVVFFTHNTAYEMRISDWSSDVCSSDLTVDKPTGTSDETQFVIPRQEQPSLLNDVRDFRSAVDAHEVAILKAALDQHRFNQRATAKALGLTYDQLRHCLRKHGLL